MLGGTGRRAARSRAPETLAEAGLVLLLGMALLFLTTVPLTRGLRPAARAGAVLAVQAAWFGLVGSLFCARSR
jgi:hypothetical protein